MSKKTIKYQTHDKKDDSADGFISMLHASFLSIKKAMLLLIPSIFVMSIASILENHGLHLIALIFFLGSVGALLGTVVLIGLLQVRFTFLHTSTHKQHFYDLKVAHFHKACAELKSLNVTEAVGAVKTLHALRREIAMLDRNLSVDIINTQREHRDIFWMTRLIVFLVTISTLTFLANNMVTDMYQSVLPFIAILVSSLAYVLIDIWASERMSCIYDLMRPNSEISRTFDPSPPLEQAVERLLTRINRHFDRLNGPREEDTEIENVTRR